MRGHILDKLVGTRVTYTVHAGAVDAIGAPILYLKRMGFDSGVEIEFRAEQTTQGIRVVPRAVMPLHPLTTPDDFDAQE